MSIFDKSLYLVTDRLLSLGRPIEFVVEEAVKGGVSIVQLREKDCSTLNFYEVAVKLKQCLRPYNVPLIINDRIDIALACDAEGLHIGQSDMPYSIARKLMGKNKIIGLSVENVEQAEQANLLDVDYIGASPVFSTPTKTDTAKALGLDGLRQIAKISRHPIVGIGGINIDNAKDIIDAGAEAIAVVSAIMSAEQPAKAAQELINRIKL
ncbi:thiamine phosphate synthase [Dysgonomonas sp. 216]|uniref:thiamine phosphate synthase n=1 Tax=Dysgonomonas sp. 216 TaxID=2302934 RepID=UPI0013D2D5F1|nr:thiamine phosphate synthase [Dysgonomonas sp. 216]NDW19183.1 thiamine phosphate synthase [Dysgonomonas sp. 216]